MLPCTVHGKMQCEDLPIGTKIEEIPLNQETSLL